MNTTPALLIIAPSWVGDMLMAHSLIQTLTQTQANIPIDLLAPQSCASVIERMPFIRNIWTHTLAHGAFSLKQRWQLAQQLRQQGYRQAFILPNSWKSALIPLLARIPKRTGYIGEWRHGLLNDARRLDKTRLPRTVDQYAALAFPPAHTYDAQQCPLPQLQAKPATDLIQRFTLNLEIKPIVALCAGAEYGAAKRWSPAYFAEVAQYIAQQGGQTWIFGSAKENAIGEQIKTTAGANCVNLCGKTTLAEAVDLLALTNAIISNDSGLMHVAAALQKPLIAIYGSSSPLMTPPLSRTAKILYLHLSCSPCFQRECPLGHLRCLNDISPPAVIAALKCLI